MTEDGRADVSASSTAREMGTALLRTPARLLNGLSPFAILEPLFYLSQTGEYSRRFDWIYLGLAVTIAFLSHFRQRQSFYYAGLINTGVSLWLITDHNQWFDEPLWAAIVLCGGLATLAAGFGLDIVERSRRGKPGAGSLLSKTTPEVSLPPGKHWGYRLVFGFSGSRFLYSRKWLSKRRIERISRSIG